MATLPNTSDIVLVKRSLLERFGERYEIETSKVLSIVSSTVFRQSKDEAPLTQEEIAAAMIVANQYELNPFTKEIYAFRSKGKLLIVVSVDGWAAIVNRQPQLDGIEFEENFDGNGKIVSVTCKIFRKDRKLPIVVTEYTVECRRNTDPWTNMPIRMTRNRSFVQCARIAFSISGLVEEDEAATIDGHNGPIIDAAQLSIEEQQCEVLMEQLKWDEKKRANARKGHRGRAAELLDYLRQQSPSTGRVRSITNAAATEAVREDEPQASNDEGPESHYEDVGYTEFQPDPEPVNHAPLPAASSHQPATRQRQAKITW